MPLWPWRRWPCRSVIPCQWLNIFPSDLTTLQRQQNRETTEECNSHNYCKQGKLCRDNSWFLLDQLRQLAITDLKKKNLSCPKVYPFFLTIIWASNRYCLPLAIFLRPAQLLTVKVTLALCRGVDHLKEPNLLLLDMTQLLHTSVRAICLPFYGIISEARN